jgi:ferredoxin-NADP reductase
MNMTSLSAIAPLKPEPALPFTDADYWAASGTPWHSGETRRLHCCAVIDETHDVKTFVFQCEGLVALSYEPGQFITVSPVINGQTVSRCYTLSSTPTRPFTFSITVKRVPGGVVSNWLHDNLRAHQTLAASGPAGSFTPVAAPARRVLYLSAGSGITPLMSMTRAAMDVHAGLDIVFVHSARTPADIIFREELARLHTAAANFRMVPICEGRGDEPEWAGHVGRLSLATLLAEVPDFRQREVFTCGPQGYMNAVQSLLDEGGFDMRRYHQESFDLNALDSVLPLIEVPVTGEKHATFSITLSRSGKIFSMSGDQTVLIAARKAGAIVPSSCSQGVCGTCKTAVLEGTVQMQHNGGIRQREIDKGMRLLCCSRPTSDLVLDL